MKRYVIVGNGVAAAACIEGIRSLDKTGEITVVSAEKHPVYCRPLISYYLEGRTDLARMNYREENFYDKNGCAVLYGRKAERIDPAAKTVVLDGGETLPYTRLCVAAGSSPFVPPFKGLDTVPEKYSFMTLDDALMLERATETPRDVLIVGAGLIGLKCAEGLHARAKSITVCALADRVLSSILDSEDAAVVQTKLEENGICFYLGNSVAEFNGNTALMQNGETVTFGETTYYKGILSDKSEDELNSTERKTDSGCWSYHLKGTEYHHEGTGTAPTALLGDADGDGKLTILDATAIQRRLASLSVASYNEKAADADEDGKVMILDATAIQRRLASLPTHEGIGEKYV